LQDYKIFLTLFEINQEISRVNYLSNRATQYNRHIWTLRIHLSFTRLLLRKQNVRNISSEYANQNSICIVIVRVATDIFSNFRSYRGALFLR